MIRYLVLCAWLMGALGLSLTVAYAGDDANPGDVVINEFMANPNTISDSDGEWVELHNTTDGPIDIDGWQLDSHTINNGGPLTIPAHAKIVLCRNSDGSANGGINCAYQASMSLTNSGDAIRLTEDGGALETIAVITYTSTLVKDGKSAFYIPLANPPAAGFFADNGDLQRWGVTEGVEANAYAASNYGTPGAINNQSGEAPAPTAISLSHFAGVATHGSWWIWGVLGILLAGGSVWWGRKHYVQSSRKFSQSI